MQNPLWGFKGIDHSAVWSEKAVTAYSKIQQLLRFSFAQLPAMKIYVWWEVADTSAVFFQIKFIYFDT